MTATRAPRPLLILSCSRRKTHRPAGEYALELYDGPAHRQVRAFLGREPIQRWPRVLILSARYGLISRYGFISPYDQRLDEDRAVELASLPMDQLEAVLYAPVERYRGRVRFNHFGPYDRIFVFGGALYRGVVEAWEARGAFRAVRVDYASGTGIGVMLGQLRDWLETIDPGGDDHEQSRTPAA